MTMTQRERISLRSPALQQLYDVLAAQHGPLFAAAFLEEFWQQIGNVVARYDAMPPPDSITTLRKRR